MKVAIKLLNRFRQLTLWWRQMRGITADSFAEERILSGQSWEEFCDTLKAAGTLVAGASLLFAKWARDFQQHSNQLPMFDPATSTAAGGDPNIIYYHSHWALAPDQVLLIEVTPPECEHWNFQLNNYWMESLDYAHYQIHTNKHLAHYEEDGSVRIIVAHRDPGLPNWINTTGHASGTMCFRWIRAKQHPQPNARVLSFAQLKTLPQQQKQQTTTV